jgi:hypothetical protein
MPNAWLLLAGCRRLLGLVAWAARRRNRRRARLAAHRSVGWRIGLAAAVLIDATIVRGVLLPATMKLLGDWMEGQC